MIWSVLFLQQYKITTAELEGSSLEDAITCRIAARDALWNDSGMKYEHFYELVTPLFM